MNIRAAHRALAIGSFSLLATLGLTGCDYWPPALQAQIEQLRSEAQQAQADKSLLQNQLNAANKAKEELQSRVEELTRVNKEKSAMIATLERNLAAERERAHKAKSSAVKPPAKSPKAAPTKPAAKPSTKPAGKKPAPSKTKAKPKPTPVKRVA